MGHMRRAFAITNVELEGVEGLMHDSPAAARCVRGSDRVGGWAWMGQ